MEILPQVRRKLMKRRTKKILESQNSKNELHDLSVEGFISTKLDHFFERLGTHEARGLYEVLLNQIEKPMIEKTLSWANGNRIKAARVLGMNRNTLRTKMKQLKIEK